MIDFGVDLEIGDDGADDLVVRAFAPIENLQLVFEDIEQPLDVAMFSV